MDCAKIGKLIRTLRLEKSLTQLELAQKLCLSDKTISKWERGLGCPDVALLPKISQLFGVNIEEILIGDLPTNDFVGGNMKNSKFYVCPICGSITVCTGSATVSCCGRKLELQAPKKASDLQKLEVSKVEDEWYITSEHTMEKGNYISFLAFATGDKLQIIKQYPEWNLQARIPGCPHGTLIWFDTIKGLFYQLL